MIITFTEDQKEQIENMGISVIRFKKMCYCLNNILYKIWDELKSDRNLMEIFMVKDNANT